MVANSILPAFFKLYQAVRSTKKRDNKKDKTERLYSTLAAAFDAHRRKTLNQDCDDEGESNVSRSAEKSAARRKSITPSSLSPSPSTLAIATPAAAAAAASTLCGAVPQFIHGASSGSTGPTHEQSSHSSPNGSEARVYRLPDEFKAIPRPSIVLVGASPTLCRSAARWTLVHNAFLGRCPALFSCLSLLCLSA